MKKKSLKRKNPFLDFQKKRSEETISNVKNAIIQIQKVHGDISYDSVASLAKRSQVGVRKNRDASMLVEQARAKQRGSDFPVDSESSFLPNSLDDCHALLRVQKYENRELKKKIRIYELLVKNYNLLPDGSIRHVEVDDYNYRAAVQIIKCILEDKVYKITKYGMVSNLGNHIAPKRICDAAGIGNDI